MATTQQSDVLPGGIREAARRLHISQRKAYQLAAAGKLPFVIRLGYVYVIPRHAFERFLAGDFRLDSAFTNRDGAPEAGTCHTNGTSRV